MSTVLPVFFLLVVLAGLMVTSFLFTPKGPHQTLIRSSAMIALVGCYLLWMCTYLAQLHPLIAPVRSPKAA